MTKKIWQDGRFITVEDDYKKSNILDSNGKKDFFLQEDNNLNPDNQQRVDKGESNLLLCWFCKKNNADFTKSTEVELYKIIHSNTEYEFKAGGTVTKTHTVYQPAKVRIKRCSKCAKVHAVAHSINMVCLIMALIAIAITILGNIPSSSSNGNLELFAICGVPGLIFWGAAIIIPKSYLRSIGTLRESDDENHPEVLSLLESGYRVGKTPGSFGSNTKF